MLSILFLYRILSTRRSLPSTQPLFHYFPNLLENYELSTRKEAQFRWRTSLQFEHYLKRIVNCSIRPQQHGRLEFGSLTYLDLFVVMYPFLQSFPAFIGYTFLIQMSTGLILIRPVPFFLFYKEYRRLFFLQSKTVITLFLLTLLVNIVSNTQSLQRPYLGFLKIAQQKASIV